MGAEILNHADGVMTLKVSGTLTEPDLAKLQGAAAGIFRKGGKWRVLVLTENFGGWARGGTWNDFSFSEHDAGIEKMAIVGERKWADQALMFTAKGLRPFAIEYFEPAQLAAARAWLTAN